MINNGWRDYWADWILGKEQDRELPRPWLTTINNKDVDKLAHQAYIEYHSRFDFLLRHTLKCNSISEFVRKFFAFIDMVFFQEDESKEDKGFRAYSGNVLKRLFK